MIESKQIKNAIITSSSHNNGAEKQFRNPVEYGGPKKEYTTFTTTIVWFKSNNLSCNLLSYTPHSLFILFNLTTLNYI